MNSAGLFSETNSVVAMTVQIDPRLSAKPRANPSTPNKAMRAQVSMLASARPDAKIFARNSFIRLPDSALRQFRPRPEIHISVAGDRLARLFGRLPPGQHPIGARVMAGVAVWVALQVILMFRLRLPEIPRRLDLGHDLARPEAGGVYVCDGVLGNPLLLLVDVVDCRPVGATDVIALPIPCGRIVDLEEVFQDPSVTDLLGIEGDLDAFGMGAVVAIGRIRNVAAGIAHTALHDAGHLAGQILHAPEAAASEDCAFSRRHISVSLLHDADLNTTSSSSAAEVSSDCQPSRFIRSRRATSAGV